MRLIICYAFVASLLALAGRADAQTILNGSFESNTATGCSYNLSNAVFNSLIQHVHGFGDSGELDFQTSGCYVTPQAGNWCIGLDSDVGNTGPDELSLELSAPLTPGVTYELAYYVYANTNFGRSPINLEVGESLVDSVFDNILNVTTAVANTWRREQIAFTATRPSRYITVRSQAGVEGWTQVDDFSLNRTNGLADDLQLTAPLALYPNPVSSTVTVQVADVLRTAAVELVDATGRVIRREQLRAVTSVLDLAFLPAGCYQLIARSGERTARAKLIKL